MLMKTILFLALFFHFFCAVVAKVALKSEGGELNVILVLEEYRYSNEWISFNTRAYNGAAPAPTLYLFPGDTLRLTIKNNLGPNENGSIPNTFHRTNTTNFHTHGLHVSPEGNSDNVLLAIEPEGGEQSIVIRIPPDHGAGTYWYHPHVHGSTACQVGGLAAGVIVIQDSTPELYHIGESIMLLQSITVSGLENKLKNFQDNDLFNPAIEGSSPLGDNTETVLVNGDYHPKYSLKPGELHRFRYVNALDGHIVELAIPGCEMHTIARDGMYFDSPREESVVVIPSGSRADILVRCSEGTYTMQTDNNEARDSIIGAAFFRVPSQEFATIEVFGHQVNMDLPNLPSRPWYSSDFTQAPEPNSTFEVQFTAKDGQNGINFIPFSTDYIGTYMKLGSLQQWRILHDMDNHCNGDRCSPFHHPFHVHVNHFQIVSIDDDNDPDGVRYKVGDWRDTIPTYESSVTVRFMTERYIGKVMVHCHVLVHEDLGMMQLMEIVDEDTFENMKSAQP